MRKWIPFVKSQPRVAIVKLDGAIAPAIRPGGAYLNDASIAVSVEKAFNRKKFSAVALSINCPGGSAAQASLIASRIRRQSREKELPVYAFVEDLAVSGGYWLALAAKEIYADEVSLIGSIGVVTSTFGFHGLLEKVGIERRLYTAGENKSLLDPFQPASDKDIGRVRHLQDSLHKVFIERVRAERGSKLDGEAQLFEGDFWTAKPAMDLGLIDGIGHLVPKMQELYGKKVKFSVFGRRKPFFGKVGAALLGGAVSEIEERSLYSRYGIVQ